jgi:hypothetical protein
LSFAGKTPIVSGDKITTMKNLERLLRALNHGSQYRLGTTNPVVKVIPTIVPASATVTFAAAQTGDTVTIGGTALTARQSRARSTITPSTAIVGNTVVVNGVTFTGVAGAATLGDPTFSVDTGNTAVVTSLVAQINAYQSPKIQGLITAMALTSTVVTLVANAEGTSGNALTLTSSGATVAVSGAGFLAGGAAIANNKFDFGSGNAFALASFVRAVNASTTAAIQQVVATSNGVDVATLTAKAGGTAGNAITLTSSNGTRLAVTGSGFLASGSQGAVTTFNL